MYKTTARHHKKAHHSDYDIYGDLAKIKDALAGATSGMKGRAGEMLSQSFDDMREKSAALQENVGTYVSEKPFKSIGAALLAGLFIGYFLHK
ncbi:MAG TPA: hypothetical protein VLI69_02010 [Gammaproteobacteria bacterium]|nr:hypothetical protein [Gammaproteobacteria bacterium]